MNILVTGGAGFIGSTLVDRLISEGHQVSIIDDLSSGKKEYINKLANFYQLNINSPEVEDIFIKHQFETVYHLAAQIDVRLSVDNLPLDSQINLSGGFNILDNCYRHGIKKIIFSSTGGAVYGKTDEIPTGENVLPYPLSPYGIHKLAFEKYLYYYYQQYGLNYTILRFANVYGPRQFKGGEAGVIAIFTDQAVNNQVCKIFGDGKQSRDFVFIDDVIEALILSLKIDCRGEINIGTGVETNLWQIIGTLEKALDKKIKVELNKAKLGEQKRSVLKVKRAKDVLDWQAKNDLMTGINKTVEWAKKQNNN
jgi:UDP-glucose 4-epimerase